MISKVILQTICIAILKMMQGVLTRRSLSTAEYKVVHYALLALFMWCMTVAFVVSSYISYCIDVTDVIDVPIHI